MQNEIGCLQKQWGLITENVKCGDYSLHHGGLGVCGKLLWGGERDRLLGGVTENFQDHL